MKASVRVCVHESERACVHESVRVCVHSRLDGRYVAKRRIYGCVAETTPNVHSGVDVPFGSAAERCDAPTVQADPRRRSHWSRARVQFALATFAGLQRSVRWRKPGRIPCRTAPPRHRAHRRGTAGIARAALMLRGPTFAGRAASDAVARVSIGSATRCDDRNAMGGQGSRRARKRPSPRSAGQARSARTRSRLILAGARGVIGVYRCSTDHPQGDAGCSTM